MILAKDLLGIDNSKDWTICLNEVITEKVFSLCDKNETQERRDRLLEHISWKRSLGSKRDFRVISTPYCLQFLHLGKGTSDWLFLGGFENKGTNKKTNGEVYELEPMSSHPVNRFCERLIVKFNKKQGPKQAKIDWKVFSNIEVQELLPDLYNSVQKPFPGYDSVRCCFSEMISIFTTPYQNWKEALSIINGIYVITDLSNGKQYVGSTYGADGVWQRWLRYVETNGHGDDKDLKKLLVNDPDYAVKNFQFSLLEYAFNTRNKRDNKALIDRESYWKDVLQTRVFGYNNN